MLKALRNKKTARKIWIVLAIIIVPAFVLWGLGGALRSKQEAAYVGRIFGREISSMEYKDALIAVTNTAIMQYGDKLPEVQKYLNLEAQAWERLILLHETKWRKIRASDKEVIELIEAYPFFQRNGQFDNRIYSQTLRYLFRIQPRAFEEQTRQNIMIAKLFNQVTRKINITPEELKEEYRKANEEISLYYIAALPSDFAKQINPSDQQIKDYYEKNSLEFKLPPSFNLDYVSVDSEEKAKNIITGLSKKEDLGKIAKNLGLTLKETGLFKQTDPIPGIGWSPEIASLISKLNIGQCSQPILYEKNYYFLRLKDKKEAYIPEFDKIKDKVKETVIKKGSGELAKKNSQDCLKYMKELYKQNPKLVDFGVCANKFNLKSDSTKLFKFGSYIEGIGASDDFWNAGASLKPQEFSDVIAIPIGFFIVKVKDRTVTDGSKFEKEKTDFAQKLLSQKKQAYFSSFVDDLKKKTQI